MKTNKKPSIYAKLVNFFKSKTIRNITLTILLICSTFCMFLLDNGNYVRDEYLNFLNNNFISEIMALFKISRFNIPLGAWILYFCIALVSAVLIIGSIFSSVFVDDKAKANEKKFKSYASAYRLYWFLYYFTLLIISAAIIFIFAQLGIFENIAPKGYRAILVSLIYTVLICFLFLLLIPITIFILYFIIKAIFFVVGYVISKLVTAVKDINAASDLQDKISQEMLEEARIAAGLSLHKDIAPQEEGDKSDRPSAPKYKDIFLPLTLIDNAEKEEPTVSEDLTLEDLALRFQSFASNNHKIYYELSTIRAYLAGLATSRLIILEGLSGTGKSMLPRMFAEFTSSKAYFTPVQATWRDKTDLLGFYSEFSRNYKVTEFLRNLYSASYSDKVNELVLDEVNLSRIEYYFADFLSILEYPEEDWKIKIYDAELGQVLPRNLKDGYVSIPNNSWFIGTANTDDSTFTITDKVYDRAVIIDFSERFTPVSSSYNPDPIAISSNDLQNLFEQAKNNDAYRLSNADLKKFTDICEFTRDAFEIKFGNRIMVQIENFVPVYVALGGTKETALDFMFASKILRKLNGSYQDYIKEELIKLKNLLEHTYGKGVFKETESLIAKITKKLV